ncbi:MAG: CBS domain-containing protein [bacterium]|nr:CBS domain-containing protein [bacterium]
MIQVKDIMTKKVITVGPDEKITEVAKSLHQNKIHAIPVTENKKLIGIITETDFFIKDLPNLYLPLYIEMMEHNYAKKITQEQKEKINKIIKATAGDIMTKNCLTLQADSDFIKAMQFFVEHKLFSAPVVDRKGRLIGIITLADIIKLI